MLSQTAQVSLSELELVLMTFTGTLLDAPPHATHVVGSVEEVLAELELVVLSHTPHEAELDAVLVATTGVELVVESHAAQVAGSEEEA